MDVPAGGCRAAPTECAAVRRTPMWERRSVRRTSRQQALDRARNACHVARVQWAFERASGRWDLLDLGRGRCYRAFARRAPTPYARARVVLTSRTLATGEGRRKIDTWRAQGAEVLELTGDVADERQMRKVLRRIEVECGRPCAVVHAAGLNPTRIPVGITHLTRDQIAEQFRAKIAGVQALARLLRDVPLDFCLLCSSLATVVGGVGFAVYTAANAYLNASARRHDLRRWISVNWDAWRFTDRQTIGVSDAERSTSWR